jgi:TonB family protein
MDAKAVGAVVSAHKGEIQACMERARMDHADLHGKVTIQATVSPAGKVLSTSVNNTVENGARLQSCVLSAFQSWTFPAPAGGGTGTITKSFVFE